VADPDILFLLSLSHYELCWVPPPKSVLVIIFGEILFKQSHMLSQGDHIWALLEQDFFYTGWRSFPSPNQQCWSTEGIALCPSI